MKLSKAKGTEERRILIGMIVDSTVLGRIASKHRTKMFKSRWANLISGWCVKYYRKYNKAPAGHIESLFETWSLKTKDKDLIKLTARFLNSISNEYESLKEESNSDYIIDLAGDYFNKVELERLRDAIEEDITDGETNKAKNRVSEWRQVEMGVGEGVDILQDKEAIKEAFEDKKEPLIIYPGNAEYFFGNAFERDGFISFVGPEGRGKSFWLQDVAWRAMEQRKRVAFFEVGDMSRNQIMRRLMVRASRCPLRPRDVNYPKKIKRVVRRSDGEEYTQIRHEVKTFKKGLTWRVAKKSCKDIMKRKTKSKKSYFKLSSHPNSTLSVSGIESILKEWERDGWVADVVVIDYADILNMDYPGIEGRDRINETWKRLRSLSQKWHNLVVTATQADARSYEAELINMSHFSDDKRKNAHVTGMIGLNQTPDEKKKGIMRLNWTKVRDDDFQTQKCLYVGTCMALANPCVISYLEK